ncbi:MAG TPA: penicillin-binding transpeptidase domain-containing protein [Methylomirabilota bacterium]|nr:penicillin-binding transpeptidase domain-containing protein [Methylomirabilota bacterium]
MIRDLGKTIFTALLVSTLALPLPAAEPGAKPVVSSNSSSSKAKSKSKSRRKLAPSRYNGYAPTYADSVSADDPTYDDPIVRQAAVDALGRYNGSVVAVDPHTGRILTVVNQRVAFSDGYIPCSTIKPTIAIAALEENVITSDTMLKVGRRKYMNLTEALAHSNNQFFEELGRRMGFDTVSKYGRLLGLGELSGYNLPDEHPGTFPMQPPAFGGVARMSSFGEGIQITPLQLAAIAAAFANGGTLYYLQYPHSKEEADSFEPKVKRDLNIGNVLPGVREGMLAAVLYGTGRLSFDAGGDETPLGKTGTCDDHTNPSRIGWFVSYADETNPRIALAVLLRGNTRRVKGPTAAQVAGGIYRRLREQNYFSEPRQSAAVSTTSGQINSAR